MIEKLDINKKTFYSDKYLKNKYEDVIFFEGYFESEKYFYEHKNELQKEFELKKSINLENNKYYELICSNNVVSIAFRSRRFTETEKDFKNQKMQNTQVTSSLLHGSNHGIRCGGISWLASSCCFCESQL